MRGMMENDKRSHTLRLLHQTRVGSDVPSLASGQAFCRLWKVVENYVWKREHEQRKSESANETAVGEKKHANEQVIETCSAVCLYEGGILRQTRRLLRRASGAPRPGHLRDLDQPCWVVGRARYERDVIIEPDVFEGAEDENRMVEDL
jgi:hypothetical protein